MEAKRFNIVVSLKKCPIKEGFSHPALNYPYRIRPGTPKKDCGYEERLSCQTYTNYLN
jgi:hypothetical protein